jgi:hypothetical protein
MRQAWFLALSRRRLLGVILAGELAFIGAGCHQHYYYYGDPACGPSTTTLPSTVQSGTTICDGPTQVVEGGTKIGNGSTIPSNVSGAKSSRVVTSEPRNSWKTKADNDSSVATTSVEGSLDSPTIKQ